MKPEIEAKSRVGRFVSTVTHDETVKAFIPPPLPPDPPILFDRALTRLLEQATLALGRLDGITTLLPDTELFIYFYVRKEAVLSAQIEGTQSSLSDFLLYESRGAPNVPLDDLKEVSNYVKAIEFGIERLAELPISTRLISEIHKILLSSGRGSEKRAGEIRRSQNWIGGTRPGNALFIPPPHDYLPDLMSDLEKFINDVPNPTTILLKAALSHLQFETIHPFLDGNGRIGRLLITLLLCKERALSEPILYLSLYLKVHRQEYYDLLQRVRVEGVWEEWLSFFLTGVMETSTLAVKTARRILELFEADRLRIEKELGRGSATALRVHHLLQQYPIRTAPDLAGLLKLTAPPVRNALAALNRIGVAEIVPGRKRNRLYRYPEYIAILNEGTEYG